MLRRYRLVLVLLLAACGTAQSQIRRCTASDGTTIYTDRRCQDLGAVERPADIAPAGHASLYRNTCPRSVRDLVYQLTSAIGSGDVNRLASVYYWAGQSTRSGYALMQRLDAIAQRPLADIVPLYPHVQPPADPRVPAVAATDQDRGTGDVDTGDAGAAAGAIDPRPDPVHRAPIGLRLEQTAGDTGTPSRTDFGLRRAYGCWWISL